MNIVRGLFVAGGAGLMIVRPLVSHSWTGLWGISYRTYNQLAAVPLLLLLLGTVALLRSRAVQFSTAARIGVGVISAGLLLSLSGIVAEFYVGAGLQGGTQSLAMWGWGIYLFGILVQIIGLVAYGLAGWRSGALRGLWRAVPLAMAASVVLWPVGMALGLNGALVTGLESLVGLGWCLWGYALSEERHAASVAGGLRTQG